MENENTANILMPKALLLEDDRATIFLIKKYLENTYTVHAAATLEYAFNLMLENEYSFYLIDVRLNDGHSGLELIKHIRSLDKYKNTPLIIESAFATIADQQTFKKAGADDFIAKPFMKNELIKKIKDALIKFSPVYQ